MKSKFKYDTHRAGHVFDFIIFYHLSLIFVGASFDQDTFCLQDMETTVWWVIGNDRKR